MKKLIAIVATIMVCAFVSTVLAGSVYDRTVVTLTPTTGAKTWTNAISQTEYAAVQLKRIWIENDSAAAQTVTVQRVTSDNAYTQSVCSVVCAANAGSTNVFIAAYLKYGDKLLFGSTTATGGTAFLDYEVQRH